VQQKALELPAFENERNVVHIAARFKPGQPYPLCILLDAKAPAGVTSENGIVSEEISTVENQPHCTRGQGSPEAGENGLGDGGKLMLARESLLTQYSCIETIQ
jgi:hypothetical protein